MKVPGDIVTISFAVSTSIFGGLGGLPGSLAVHFVQLSNC
jgi:hypothetical protein